VTPLESARRRMDWYIERRIPPHPADVLFCREVAAQLREQGLRGGALSIDDRIKEAYARARLARLGCPS